MEILVYTLTRHYARNLCAKLSRLTPIATPFEPFFMNE